MPRHAWAGPRCTYAHDLASHVPRYCGIPCGGPTHERLAQADDESPQTTSSGDVWTQRQHGTCNASAHATGFDRALTYSPPFFVRAHPTTKEDCTPGTLKASQVALVEPVAYLKDLVNRMAPIRCQRRRGLRRGGVPQACRGV